PCKCIIGILFNCLLEILDSSLESFLASLVPEETTLEIKLISPGVFREAFLENLLFIRGQSDLERLNDLRGNLFLNVKNVLHRPAIGFGPYVLVAERVNELCCNSQISTLSPYTSFQ